MTLDSTRCFSRCQSRGGERLLNMLAVCTGSTTGNGVIIYDYVDPHIPMLARMAARKFAGYSSLGYETGLNRSEHKTGLFADH